MRHFLVVELDVHSDSFTKFRHGARRIDIDVLLLDGTPEALYSDVRPTFFSSLPELAASSNMVEDFSKNSCLHDVIYAWMTPYFFAISESVDVSIRASKTTFVLKDASYLLFLPICRSLFFSKVVLFTFVLSEKWVVIILNFASPT